MNRTTRRSLAALGLASLTILAACSDDSPGPGAVDKIDALPRPLTAAEQEVARAGNGFSFSLFREVSRAQPDSNVFISPLSASMALGMTMNGAAGETYDAMRATLGFGGASQEAINEGYRSLIALLRGLDPTTDFRIANSIWYRQGYPFEQSFLSTTKTYFDAEVQGLDFANPASLSTINGWVDCSTNGKITKILDVITPQDVMFLINAIYFKGSWRYRFDRNATRDAQFHAGGGAAEPVKLMYQKAPLRYLATPEFQAVDLLYGNTAFAMTVLLPAEGADVNALVASLGEAAWADWTGRFTETEVELYLPKLKLEYERLMNDDLTALGMGVAFEPGGADFTRLSPRGRELFIAFVKQKTYVDIYEEGTEAAAVTAVGIRETSAPPTPPVMRVDRPFVFAIRERFSGTILFIGKIVRMPPG